MAPATSLATAVLDPSSLTTALSVDKFASVIEGFMPLIGVAVIVGFLFYVTRYVIGLFRGI